jgi:hypothetical protein
MISISIGEGDTSKILEVSGERFLSKARWHVCGGSAMTEDPRMKDAIAFVRKASVAMSSLMTEEQINEVARRVAKSVPPFTAIHSNKRTDHAAEKGKIERRCA